MKRNRILALLLALCMLLSAGQLAAAAATVDPEAGVVKNVILMIGDGMGENHLLLAREQGYELFMDRFYDLRGQSKTRSASHLTTDSAAGGTALSSGLRIINQTVAVYPNDPLGLFSQPRTIAEHALAKGLRSGIVTTDQNTGATPASFTVHTLWRKQYEEISNQQLQSQFDLIWGAKDGYITRQTAKDNGWTFVNTKEAMNALTPGSRSFGQFSSGMWRAPMNADDKSPSLAEMTVKAIELLSSGNDNGFFLMVEGAHIDKNSHAHDDGDDYPQKKWSVAMAVKGFDDAIKEAVAFARKDGHTIVLVTADHETGNLYLENGVYTFHSHEHTSKNVPVFVYGCDDLFAPGEAVDNYTIPIRLAEKLGWSSEEFPTKDPGRFMRLFKKITSIPALTAA
jgi:alkaline phosphatase